MRKLSRANLSPLNNLPLQGNRASCELRRLYPVQDDVFAFYIHRPSLCRTCVSSDVTVTVLRAHARQVLCYFIRFYRTTSKYFDSFERVSCCAQSQSCVRRGVRVCVRRDCAADAPSYWPVGPNRATHIRFVCILAFKLPKHICILSLYVAL